MRTRFGPRAVGFAIASLGIAAAVGCDKRAAVPPAPPPPAVTVARPVSYPVQEYYEYNGYLDAIESVEIRARVQGFLNDVLFHEGDEVKQGDRLYQIDPREYEADVAKGKADIAKAAADIENAKAQIKLSEAELDRLNRLSGATSRSEIDKATATLAANKAQLGVAAANKAAAEAALQTAELQLGYTDIRAPIAGRISRTQVTRGNLVGQNEATLLTTIVGVDPLYVYFDVPEKDLVEYQLSLREHPQQTPAVTEFPVDVGVATEKGFPHRGVIDFRENRVDTGTGTVRIRGRIPNPPIPPGNARILYPGLYARVRVPESVGPQPRMVIPEDALMTGQEGRFVFVIGKENTVQKRSVTVGPQVWRASQPNESSPAAWSLIDPNPPAAPAPDGAGKDAPPAKGGGPVRSAVAINAGLNPDDLVVVNGLQRAQQVQPGKPVAPDVWELRPPVAAK